MSLDVYLKVKDPIVSKGTGVFVRENGATRELSAEEVSERFPGAHVSIIERETTAIYHDNITHNLNEMAKDCGIYAHLWRPEEIGINKASELIEPLRQGLHNLKSDPERYKQFNPANGWGDYEGLVRFVSDYLDACYLHPDAIVEASR